MFAAGATASRSGRGAGGCGGLGADFGGGTAATGFGGCGAGNDGCGATGAGAAGAGDGDSKITWKLAGFSGQGCGGRIGGRISRIAATIPTCRRQEPINPIGFASEEYDSTGRDTAGGAETGMTDASPGVP
jgi:hypothetical protein